MVEDFFVALVDGLGASIHDSRTGRRTAVITEDVINVRHASQVVPAEARGEYLLVVNQRMDVDITAKAEKPTGAPRSQEHGTVTYRLVVDDEGHVAELAPVKRQQRMAPAYKLPGYRMVDDEITTPDGSAVYRTISERDSRGDRWTCLIGNRRGSSRRRVVFRERHPQEGRPGNYSWTTPCPDRSGQFMLLFRDGYFYRVELETGELDAVPFREGTAYSAAW
jgi:hypothetical protein